ncbi:MAG: M23 family metallopeptidase [Myxococcota bacterium]
MLWIAIPVALAQNGPTLQPSLALTQPDSADAALPSEQLDGEGLTAVDADGSDVDAEYDDFVVPGTRGVVIDMPEVTDIEWQWPLYGRVSSHYGWRVDPRRGGRTMHHGIDIAAAPGRRVKAAGVGVVSYAGRGGGYGNLVEVRHPDGHITRYAHMTQLLVKAGQQVQAGDPVGTVGNTGRSTGPHLHFEFRVNRKTEDPAVIAIMFGDPVDARAQQKTAVLRAPATPGSPLEEALREGLNVVRQLLTLAIAPFV